MISTCRYANFIRYIMLSLIISGRRADFGVGMAIFRMRVRRARHDGWRTKSASPLLEHC